MSMEIPEHLRTGPLADAAKKALEDATKMAASSNSVPRISLKGREFRLIDGGEEIAKFRDSLNVIILGVEPEAGRMIKTWYKDGYKSGSKEPPTCSSDDGVSPANWVNDKQAANCSQCPKNQFGSAISPSGKPTKACRDSKRIWVRMADNHVLKDDVRVLHPTSTVPFAERTMFGLNVTVASLKAFSEYGKKLASLGQGPAVCVTKLVMLDMEYPQLDFQLLAWLDAQVAPLSLEISAKKPWKIQYANAGLALAHDGSSSNALPVKLPGQVPDVPPHLQTQQVVVDDATSEQLIAKATERLKQDINIDDAIGKW